MKNQTNCRVCDSTRLTEYLDLGLMPLSNNLCKTADEEPERYPLKVLLCEDCGLSQLSAVIDPNILFGHYVYRSSISQGYKDHCYNMAKTLKEKYNLSNSSFHIDIAGNDGALLSEFRKILNHRVLNVDPAENMVPICDAQDIRIFRTFWGNHAADHLNGYHWPKANLITATNVFAHVDNVFEFLTAARKVMAPGGVLVLEFPYLIDFIENSEFDTIYFEHVSYFSVCPLAELCQKVGMSIIDISHHPIHGGSLRVEIKDGVGTGNIASWLHKEYMGRYFEMGPYREFSKKVTLIIKRFKQCIVDLRYEGNNIAAFAASAKGNTLLNAAKVGSDQISYIIDETPEKIGMYSPGTKIPIVNVDKLVSDPPDYLIILSWNFSDEIIKKCKALGYKGKFILPLTFEVI